MIYRASTAEEAVKLRHENPSSVYLAGGTEIMRLGSSAAADVIIDITALPLSGIEAADGKVSIGALAVLQDIKEAEVIPSFIREAASFCASLQLRNAATVGGNFALRRTDSYMAAALLASECDVEIMCSEGVKKMAASAYFEKPECRGLLLRFIVDTKREGRVKRISRASHMHAAVTAAVSEGCYAWSVSGSGTAYGHDRDGWKNIDIKDDLTGSAEYKRYLASVLL